MTKAEAFWNASAGNYDRTEARFEYIHAKSRDYAKQHLHADHVVLDYGCGTGTTACEVAHLVREIHGIDISSEMINLAREKVAAGGVANATLARADIFDDGYKAESFDVILAFNVLHTVPDPEQVVRRMQHLLKPGGLVVSVTPCFRDQASIFGRAQLLFVRALCMARLIPIPIRSVSSADLDELILYGGEFEKVQAENIFRGISSYFLTARKVAPPDGAELDTWRTS